MTGIRSRFGSSVLATAALVLLAIPCALMSCASAPPDIPPEQRLIVAVAPLAAAPQSPVRPWEDELTADLVKTNRVRVIERARLEAILDENQLAMSALGDPAANTKALSVIGADAVLITTVAGVREYSGKTTDEVTGWWSDVSLGIEVKASGRLVSTTTGEVLVAADSTGKAEAGTFYGAMGESTVDKSRDDLVGDAVSDALAALVRQIAKVVPAKS